MSCSFGIRESPRSSFWLLNAQVAANFTYQKIVYFIMPWDSRGFSDLWIEKHAVSRTLADKNNAHFPQMTQ
ncbi:MAG: hypothetical protein A3C83_01850 [Candidatus Ryanbacteria bacterium RIFCSPHIGHO2_02_FULL_47_25]|nr:MAG: hypothetical protein A3C83_01850 [Candidatus Ryanbacteria bacterium RIFCSPHIGHO2_02_FULL_47_25]